MNTNWNIKMLFLKMDLFELPFFFLSWQYCFLGSISEYDKNLIKRHQISPPKTDKQETRFCLSIVNLKIIYDKKKYKWDFVETSNLGLYSHGTKYYKDITGILESMTNKRLNKSRSR